MGVGGGSETGGQSGSGLTGTSFNSYRAGPLDVDSHTLRGPLARAEPLASCVAQSAHNRRDGSTLTGNQERKSCGEGKSVAGRVTTGCRCIITKTHNEKASLNN